MTEAIEIKLKEIHDKEKEYNKVLNVFKSRLSLFEDEKNDKNKTWFLKLKLTLKNFFTKKTKVITYNSVQLEKEFVDAWLEFYENKIEELYEEYEKL